MQAEIRLSQAVLAAAVLGPFGASLTLALTGWRPSARDTELAMSQENVEIACRLLEAIARADYDHAAAYLDPEAEWRNTAAFPGPRKVVGADAIREFWRDLFGALGGDRTDSTIEVEQVADADEMVAVLVHGRGQGRGSGIPIDTRWAHTFWIRDSKVHRIETFGRFPRALEAAGLRE